MAIGNEKLRHERFPKHSSMGTARIKQDKATEDEGKRSVSIERSKADTKGKRSRDGLNYPNQNTIIMNIVC